MCRRNLSTPVALSLAFACLYMAIGPGRFFSVDEVVVEATARAAYSRGTLEIASMNTAVRGRGDARYSPKGPALGYIAMPFVIVGDALDRAFGSLNGGALAGPPLGTLEHPLRWGGRLSVFTVLALNALIGGCAVGILYLIVLGMSGDRGTALLVASAGGIATLLASESTHFFQHPLETLLLLAGFWCFLVSDVTPVRRLAFFGGLSLGLAVLTRPNSGPAAAVIFLCGVMRLCRQRSGRGPNPAAAVGWALAPMLVSGALYLLYNDWRFGDPLNFGYNNPGEQFHVSVEALRAAAAYLVSPSLSIFLFAPPLLLIPFTLKETVRRWPLESGCLLLAAGAHLLLITLYGSWDGAIAFGPRFMLAPMVLLMPLTIPAFEKARYGLGAWKPAVIAAIVAGMAIQVIGIAVYVTVNEWYRSPRGLIEHAAYVFTPSASPIWIQLQELLAGRNLTPWAVRAAAAGSPLLFVVLIALATFYYRASSSGTARHRDVLFPAAVATILAAFTVLGFAITRPIVSSAAERLPELMASARRAQDAGHVVEASELYAIVLTLDPGDNDARHKLAALYTQSGRSNESAQLIRPPEGHANARDCGDARACYEAGKRFADLGDIASALAVWESATRKFPADVWMLRNVAWARYQLGDYKGAVRDYSKVAQSQPADNGVLTDLAWALLKAGQPEEAGKICSAVLMKDPRNTSAVSILAQLGRR